MILVARSLAQDIAKHASDLEKTDPIKAAQTLPGYQTYERAIQSQYELSTFEESKPVGHTEDHASKPES